LGKNLLRNGSFETPLTTDSLRGWAVKKTENGVQARLVSGVAHSGQKSLLLEQTTPVVFLQEAYDAPNFEDFRNRANGGKGGGYLVVEQEVPVVAGKAYSLRLYYRPQVLHEEIQKLGKNRGYAAFRCTIHWRGHVQKELVDLWVADQKESADQWKELHNERWNYWKAPKPYVAPEGATTAVISLALTTLVGEKLPKVYVDDVEFAATAP
jgi:hypothetical protein